MKFGNISAGLRTILKARTGSHKAAMICSLRKLKSYLKHFFFHDSDLIVPHLYSLLKSSASEAVLKTQHSPKGPDPTPIQINSLQWSLFVASQQD